MAGVFIAFALLLIVSVIFAGVVLAVHLEEGRNSLTGDAPGWLARIARRLNGVGRRTMDARPRPVGELVR